MPLFYHILSIPAKLLTCLNASPPAHRASGGGCIGQVSNPRNSIGTAVQPQVVIKRTNGPRFTRAAKCSGAASGAWRVRPHF